MKNYTESELRKIISNYEKHTFNTINNALVELKKRGGTIGSGVLENISKHFGKEKSEDMFIENSIENNSDVVKNLITICGEIEILTEDKFDKDIIPKTKIIGIIISILSGGSVLFFNGNWFGSIVYVVVGIMGTLGLCVILEGISTIIKLLRKISEK
jgi:hypothetical protein